MIKTIILDFNGTIINDVQLCLDLLNDILIKQNKKTLTQKEYKNVFTFPVKKYYEAAGVDFTQQSFEELADWFIQEYQPASLNCGLYDGLVETFEFLRQNGIRLVILSASEKGNLLQQCRHYDICKYFDAILGIDNIHASGKVDIAINYLEQEHLNGEETLFVGDTLHDLEVAKAIHSKCMLVSCGHQSVEVLSTGNVPIIESVAKLRDLSLLECL